MHIYSIGISVRLLRVYTYLYIFKRTDFKLHYNQSTRSMVCSNEISIYKVEASTILCPQYIQFSATYTYVCCAARAMSKNNLYCGVVYTVHATATAHFIYYARYVHIGLCMYKKNLTLFLRRQR